MGTVNVNFRLDEDLKRKFEETCAGMGLSITAALTMFITRVIRDGRIPFEVTAQPSGHDTDARRGGGEAATADVLADGLPTNLNRLAMFMDALSKAGTKDDK